MNNKKTPAVELALDSEYAAITSFADKCFKKDENSQIK